MRAKQPGPEGLVGDPISSARLERPGGRGTLDPIVLPIEGHRLLLALAEWVLSSVAVGFATSAVLPRLLPEWAGDPSRLSAAIVAEVYGLLIVSLVLAMGGPAEARRRMRVLPVDVRTIGATLLLWAGAYLGASAAYLIASAIFPPFPSPADLARFLAFIGTDMGRLHGADSATWALVLVRACLLAPVGEELLFRGALFRWLRRRLAGWTTIGITALAFAAIHGLAPTMIPLALFVGIAAGYARERFGSVTPLVIVHIAQNLLVELAGLWSLR